MIFKCEYIYDGTVICYGILTVICHHNMLAFVLRSHIVVCLFLYEYLCVPNVFSVLSLKLGARSKYRSLYFRINDGNMSCYELLPTFTIWMSSSLHTHTQHYAYMLLCVCVCVYRTFPVKTELFLYVSNMCSFVHPKWKYFTISNDAVYYYLGYYFANGKEDHTNGHFYFKWALN